jgi:hypothetical protein
MRIRKKTKPQLWTKAEDSEHVSDVTNAKAIKTDDGPNADDFCKPPLRLASLLHFVGEGDPKLQSWPKPKTEGRPVTLPTPLTSIEAVVSSY